MDSQPLYSHGSKLRIVRLTFFAAASLLICASVRSQQRADLDPFFEAKVRPILANRCWSCHSGESGQSKGSLRLDHGILMEQGGDSGPAVVAGKPEESLLYQAVTYQGYEMPPDGRLPEEEIQILRTWIERGAQWPEEPLPEDRAEQTIFDLKSRKDSHWAWQPRSTNVRAQLSGNRFRTDLFTKSPIDVLIAEKINDAGLVPSSQADRVTLARRLYLDLIGIPPTITDIENITSDPRPDWDAALVDRLLADPQFGVRWARHWLDLVRYAQSRGHEFDEDIPSAEAYRDYIVRALNDDLPYDQFLREHLAGDLVDPPRQNPINGSNESVLATGFWHLGDWVHSPVDTRKDETDRLDNMVDVATKTFLGMTVACARCHDHKFDAISTQDYYALFGFLRSSHYRLVRYETDIAHRHAASELELIRSPWRNELNETLRAMTRSWLESTVPADLEQPHFQRLIELRRQWTLSESQRLPTSDPRVVFDARQPDRSLWKSDGVIYGSTARPPLSDSVRFHNGQAAWTIHPMHEAARDHFWDPMSQHVDAVNRQNRYAQVQEAGKILPTKMFPLRTGKLSYLVRGSIRVFASVDSHRLIAGPLHGETLLESNGSSESYRWVTHSLDRYVGKTIHLEFSPIADQDFALVQVIDGLPPEATESTENDSPVVFINQIREALNGWLSSPNELNDQQLVQCAAMLQELVRNPESWLGAGHSTIDRLKNLTEQWHSAEQTLAGQLPWHSRLGMAMRDGSGIDDAVLIRGNHLRPGNLVPRRNLEALSDGLFPYQGTGSGRLELALQWTHPDNPLVARVIANRVWHHLTGRGLAATTDDFGALGTPPSHPLLLDMLAQDMIEQGWSIKSLIRAICLSHTYQQASIASLDSMNIDPDNELLSHARVRRLESEAIRDTLLAVTGELDLRWMPDAESSVPVHLTDFLEGRGRPNRSGPLDGRAKRSLYLEVRRNFLHPMMTAFDMPNPFSSMGRRNVSNVPAQALILLNDPLVHQVAGRWSQRIVDQFGSDEHRVRAMLREVGLREPSNQQMEQAIAFIHSDDFENAKVAYHALAHMLLNRKDLLFRF
jgi:hypothetical protein